MDYTINEYCISKGYNQIKDISSKKNKYASDGEFAVIDFLNNNGFAVTFKKRGLKDTITIQKGGISLDIEFRAELKKSEYPKMCKRFLDDFSQYCELVKLREQVSTIKKED